MRECTSDSAIFTDRKYESEEPHAGTAVVVAPIAKIAFCIITAIKNITFMLALTQVAYKLLSAREKLITVGHYTDAMCNMQSRSSHLKKPTPALSFSSS